MPYKTAAEKNAEIVSGSSFVPQSIDEAIRSYTNPILSYLTIDGMRTHNITLRDAHVEFNRASAYVNEITYRYQYDET